MSEVLEHTTLERWQRDPLSFINEVLRNPETGKPFELFDAQKTFFAKCWQTDDSGRLLYPEQCIGWPKKTGKTATAAMHLLTTTLVFGGRFAEGYAIANDLEQAQGRVFQSTRRICECSPHLQREYNITQSRIEFPQTGAVISAIAGDYAGAAGAHPVVSAFDEAWAYTSERSRRLWDEMVPVPTRKISCRLVVTHAGFSGESTLLEEICARGLTLPEIGDGLRGGNGMLFTWCHVPLAPWQDAHWLADMRRSLRPNQFARMVLNEFVSTDSAFVSMADWDRCVDPQLSPVLADRRLLVWVAIDASVKHDSTALAAVTFDTTLQKVRLVNHRIFQPSPTTPINFERHIEDTILDWSSRYKFKSVRYDPFQMVGTSQRLTRAGIPMEEFAQTIPHLTEMSCNLFELVQGRNLIVYPNEDLRLAVARAVAVEGTRGWKITKEKASHKIDAVIALAMAAHAAVVAHREKPRRLRMAFCGSAYGVNAGYEVDPVTLERIDTQQTRQGIVLTVQDEQGNSIRERRLR